MPRHSIGSGPLGKPHRLRHLGHPTRYPLARSQTDLGYLGEVRRPTDQLAAGLVQEVEGAAIGAQLGGSLVDERAQEGVEVDLPTLKQVMKG